MKEKIRKSAFYYLSQREHSQQELRTKLERKAYPRQEINSVLDELAAASLQSDQRFMDSYIRLRQSRGFGPLRVIQELQNRGIPAEMIAEVVQITDNIWFMEAKNAWSKRFKGKAVTSFADRAKQMRFLQYRGYTREQIEHAIDTRESKYEHLS